MTSQTLEKTPSTTDSGNDDGEILHIRAPEICLDYALCGVRFEPGNVHETRPVNMRYCDECLMRLESYYPGYQLP